MSKSTKLETDMFVHYENTSYRYDITKWYRAVYKASSGISGWESQSKEFAIVAEDILNEQDENTSR